MENTRTQVQAAGRKGWVIEPLESTVTVFFLRADGSCFTERWHASKLVRIGR